MYGGTDQDITSMTSMILFFLLFFPHVFYTQNLATKGKVILKRQYSIGHPPFPKQQKTFGNLVPPFLLMVNVSIHSACG